MSEASIRDLRNHGGDIVERAARGEQVTITRAGKPVAELRPLRSPPLSAALLVARWQNLPAVDPTAFRRDLDATIDPGL